MSKDESIIMKGVAILLMIYLHLFNKTGNLDNCMDILYINHIPISNILSRATNPVSFFLILSGYGLYRVQSQRKNYNVIKKIRNLYIHYWITLMLFVPLGAYVVGSSIYPGSWEAVIANVTAWHTTWNGEIWFLFPYMLMALSSKWLFSLMDRINIWLFMGGAFLLTMAAMFCISRYGQAYFYHNQLAYMPILYFGLLFAFVLVPFLLNIRLLINVNQGGRIGWF